MLSRATSLEGLLLLRPPEKDDLNRKPPQYLVDEVDRLLGLEKSCTRRLAKEIRALKGKVPDKILALFSEDAEEIEQRQVQAIREKNMTMAKSAVKRVEPPESSTQQLQVKRRRIVTKQSPPLWMQMAACLVAAGVTSAAVSHATADEERLRKKTRRGSPPARSEGLTASEQIPSDDSTGAQDIDTTDLLCQECGPAESALTCTASLHVCMLDRHAGCAACGQTCHSNCDDDRCAFEVCNFCQHEGLTVHENADLCIEAQTNTLGCHSCGRVGCWSSSLACHTKCTRDVHVCGPSVNDPNDPRGCTSCKRLCHVNNKDVRCHYFQRDAGQLTWVATQQQLLDTDGAMRDLVTHVDGAQITWHVKPYKLQERYDQVSVDGQTFYVGHGDHLMSWEPFIKQK